MVKFYPKISISFQNWKIIRHLQQKDSARLKPPKIKACLLELDFKTAQRRKRIFTLCRLRTLPKSTQWKGIR